MSRYTGLFFLCLFLSTVAYSDEIRIKHDGITLNANLVTTDANWNQGTVVLLTHGTLAHRGMEIMAGLQELLLERDISSMAINLSLGLDDRAAAMYDCKIPHTHQHTDAVGEIGAWLNWLQQQGVSNIALLGHSRGGNQVARYAATHPEAGLTQVVLIAPQTWDEGKLATGYQKRYAIPLAPLLQQANEYVAEGKRDKMMQTPGFIYCEDTQATAEAFSSYYTPDPKMDTPILVPEISAPVTVFAGSEDKVVVGLVDKVEPIADGRQIRLEIIEGADHFFRDLYLEDIADQIAELVAAK